MTAPRDEKIVHRVLKGADLTARDREGHTILHKIVLHDRPENAAENTLRVAMSYGADLSARDCNGRTPRDLAKKLQKEHYCKCIDEYIIKLVKDRKFEDIEKLILHNYDHLLDITDSGNRTLVDIAKKYGTRQIHEVVKLTAAIQVNTLFPPPIPTHTLYPHPTLTRTLSPHIHGHRYMYISWCASRYMRYRHKLFKYLPKSKRKKCVVKQCVLQSKRQDTTTFFITETTEYISTCNLGIVAILI